MRPRKSTRSLCQLLGKSTQGYYDNRKRTSEADGQEIMALNLVLEKRKVHKKAGTIELYHMLKEDFKAHNIKIGRDKLHRLLKEHNLILKIKGRKPKTTDPTGADKHFPNQIRELLLTRSNQLWVSDMTYIRVDQGFVYLSLITDAYSKKIVGWTLWPTMDTCGFIKALDMAISTEKPIKPLIHHSDRGTQYRSAAYVGNLKHHNISISMTEDGDPYENAIAESLNKTLKEKYDLKETFEDYYDALEAAKKAVYLYNYEKPHSSCGYMTPIMAHDYKGPLINKWKTKSVEKNQQKKRLGYAKRVIKKLLNKKSVTEEYLMDLISKLSKRYQLNQENLEVEIFKTVNNNTC